MAKVPSQVIAFFFIVGAFLLAKAGTTVVVNQNGAALPNINVTQLNSSLDSLKSWQTNSNGNIPVDLEFDSGYLLEAEGYSPLILHPGTSIPDTIRLSESIELKELSIESRSLLYTTFRIPPEAMRRYGNFYQALNEIPNLTVLNGGQLFYEGSSNVVLLLNGVQTTPEELRLLSNSDIQNIRICQDPPLRYVIDGVTAVVDVRTRDSLFGGNIGIDLNQSFVPLKGENSAAIFYNFGHSRLTFEIQNENKHFTRARYSQCLEYEFDNIKYYKYKEGLNSPHRFNSNVISAAYQLYRYRNYLYHLSVGCDYHNTNNTDLQKISSSHTTYAPDATNVFKTRYSRPWVRNYFEKYIKDGDMRLMANVMFHHQSTDYLSQYTEHGTANVPTGLESASQYHINYNGIIGEVQYEIYPGWGAIVADIFGRHRWADYADLHTGIQERESMVGGSVKVKQKVGKIIYSAGMGVSGKMVRTSVVGQSQNLWVPAPSLTLTLTDINPFNISAGYSYFCRGPGLAELSQTPQWLDNKLVFHGNAELKPYKVHRVDFRASANTKYLDLSLRGLFQDAPGMICNHYIRTDRYILETIVNLDKYTEIQGTLDFTLKPLGNYSLTFYNRLILAHLHGRGPSYGWNGYRYQWMSQLSWRLPKWTFEIFYQLPGKVAEGQLIMPRAQVWNVSAAFRPREGLSCGLTVSRPFGGAFRESERTVGSSLVSNEYITEIYDWRNMVSLTLSWNFSFGKNRESRSPLMSHWIDDNGVLQK